MVAQCRCRSTPPCDVIIPHAFSEAIEIALISTSTSTTLSASTSSSLLLFEPIASSPPKHQSKMNKMVRFHKRVKVTEYTRWCSPQLGASINEMVQRNYKQRYRIHRFIRSWDLERQCGHLHDDLCTILDELETWEDPDDIVVFKRAYEMIYCASATPRPSKRSGRGSPTSVDDNLNMSRSTSSDANSTSYLAIPTIDKKQTTDIARDGDVQSVVDKIEMAYRRLDSKNRMLRSR